jgi:hypothetical protein
MNVAVIQDVGFITIIILVAKGYANWSLLKSKKQCISGKGYLL